MQGDLIIYAIVAAALVFWLKNILGTKHGDERDRGNPFAPPNDNRPGVPPVQGQAGPKDPPESERMAGKDTGLLGRGTNIFTPAGVDPLRITRATLSSRVRIEGDAVTNGLRGIVERDPGFTLEKFLGGAEAAFELIVTSFAKGDRSTLQGLLAPSVYNNFDAAITDRTTRGETVETRIEALRGMDITAARMGGDIAYISVRFTAQETCIIRNAAGMITAGDPDVATTMIDIWTFGHDVTSNNPAWYIYETRDDVDEPHKTPMPESRL